jgi:2-C-methyl-D-erythritol 4-phosphate cytidylyltransferase
VGARLGGTLPKQYLKLDDNAMINHTIMAFLNVSAISRVFVLLSPTDDYWETEGLQESDKLKVLHCGGATRAQTVKNGLAAIAGETNADDWILVHDAARPCITVALVNKLMNELQDDPVGGLLALPIPDTVKKEENRRVHSTVPREHLWLAQTPQMFRYGLIQEALAQMGESVSTDEAQAVEVLGKSPKLVVGHMSNFKVTYAEDVLFASSILKNKA